MLSSSLNITTITTQNHHHHNQSTTQLSAVDLLVPFAVYSSKSPSKSISITAYPEKHSISTERGPCGLWRLFAGAQAT